MASEPSESWLARGRAHQRDGAFVDALFCFRHAVTADPSSTRARLHLGDALWRLGQSQAAIAEWQQAVRSAPADASTQQALAEALLLAGDLTGASKAALQVPSGSSEHARAELVMSIASLALSNPAGDPAELDRAIARTTAAIAREPGSLQLPAIAEPLASVVDRHGFDARFAMLEAIVTAMSGGEGLASMPARLFALAVDHVMHGAGSTRVDRAALAAAAARRDYTAADHDALRRIALAMADGDRDRARALGERYARLCVSAFSAHPHLLWPRRTAGTRLRIIVLMAHEASDSGALDLASRLMRLPDDAFQVVFALVGGNVLPPTLAAEPMFASARVAALPASPDRDTARRLAPFDADVLVDLAGLVVPTGPVLAARPARAIVTVSSLVAANEAPLIDRAFADAAELVADTAFRQAALATTPCCPIDGAALAATWDAAVRAHQRGERDQAEQGYRRVLELEPGHAPALFLAGVARKERGDYDGARAAFDAALAAAPRYVDARVAAARTALDQHEADQAAQICLDGVTSETANVQLWRALGHAQLARRDGASAALAFSRALALDPVHAETHYNHGVALQTASDFSGAARAYQRAVAFAPRMVAAHFNLGVVFQQQANVDAAIAAYENAIASDPRHPGAYKNLGEVLFGAGLIERWFANFRRFEANCPTSLLLAVSALEVCHYRGDFDALDRCIDGLRSGRFEASDDFELVDALEELLYLLLYFDVEPPLMHRLASDYDASARRVYGEPLPPATTRRPGRVRVGYLSADLRNHVMGKMAWSAVEHHDRDRFDLYFYSLSATEDAWTSRFRGIGRRFEVLADLSERDAATRIANDDLDLLIDLCTHTKGAKPGILALKPARVQITHIASAGTLGLSTVDFKLTDRFADLPQSARHQIEAPLPMDGCVYPYRHIGASPDAFTRNALGIAADTVVIGAFVSGLKLSRRCLRLWRAVLARIPSAKLAFSPVRPVLRPLYERVTLAGGIPADRLLFLPQGRDDHENQARYAVVDFALDPMPFGGTNGVLEPLDAGVPVVTLVGERHGERTGYSILANLGVTQTVAYTEDEYVELAVRLANDAAFMRGVREAIRAGLEHSPLTDRVGYTRALERAYLQALAARAPAALAR